MVKTYSGFGIGYISLKGGLFKKEQRMRDAYFGFGIIQRDIIFKKNLFRKDRQEDALFTGKEMYGLGDLDSNQSCSVQSREFYR